MQPVSRMEHACILFIVVYIKLIAPTQKHKILKSGLLITTKWS